MDIKCLAFDVDGTLTNDQKEIDPRTKASIQEAMERGIHIVISSGRNKEGCEFIYEPLGLEKGNHFLSLVNGQQIYDFERDLYINDKLLSSQDCLKIERICRKYQCLARFTIGNTAAFYAPIPGLIKELLSRVKKTKKHGGSMSKGTKFKLKLLPYRDYVFKTPVNKVVFFRDEEFFVENLNQLKKELRDYDVMMVSDGWMEIMPKGVNKASGLQKIADACGITMENIMAFGDAQNDIDMIVQCGVGVAMGNAREDVKALADIVADTNNNNGIGKVIDQYVLGKTVE